MDEELLEELYVEYDGNITEMCRQHDFDVTRGRVRNYLVEFGIHEVTPQTGETSVEDAACSPRYVKGVLAAIIAEGGPVDYDSIAERLDVSTTTDVSTAASALERRKIVTKHRRDGGMFVDLNVDGINEIRRAAAEREKTEQLMGEIG